MDKPAVLLGSAGAPWPVPGCRCVACRAHRSAPRSPSVARVGAVVVDGRGGVTASGGEPVTPRAGDRLEVEGVRVLALPGPAAGTTALVLGTAGATLLWSPFPGLLPDVTLEALQDAGLDGAALAIGSEPAGPAGPAGPDPDLRDVAHQLARLRAVRALSPGCDAVPLGLTHDVRPVAGPAADLRLARWGVRAAADGDPWPTRQRPAPTPARTLVLGPASSGKSQVAEDLLAAEPEVVYAATGPAPDDGDPSWQARVRAHRGRRPPWWRTQEAPDLAALLRAPGPPLLVDALGTWLAAALDRSGAWDDAAGWRERLDLEVDTVVRAWRQADRRVVAVGEEVGWGVVPATAAGGRFREALGDLVRRLAGESEQVLLVVAGTPVDLAAPGAGAAAVAVARG